MTMTIVYFDTLCVEAILLGAGILVVIKGSSIAKKNNQNILVNVIFIQTGQCVKCTLGIPARPSHCMKIADIIYLNYKSK